MSPASETFSPPSRTVRATLAGLAVPLCGTAAAYVAWDLAGATAFAIFAAIAVALQERLQRQPPHAAEGLDAVGADPESASQAKQPEGMARILAVASQDVRSCLESALRANDEFLESDLSPPQRQNARNLRTKLCEALSGVQSELELCALETAHRAGPSEVFELLPLLENAFDALHDVARRRGGELHYVVARDLPRAVIGHRDAFDRALRHLIRHGIENTQGGETLVTVEAETEGGLTRAVKLAVRLRCEAGDSTAPGRNSGRELDLVIARRLMERMGGGIEKGGAGPEVPDLVATMILEVCDPEPATESVAEGRKLLVVGGSQQARVALAEHGGQLGLDCHLLGSGDEALERLAQPSFPVQEDSIVVFIESPGEPDGPAFGRRLQAVLDCGERQPHLLLVHDAALGSSPRLWARAGFDAWIAKPVGARRLAGGIRQALLGSGQVRSAQEESVEIEVEAARAEQVVLLVEDNVVNQKVAELLLSKIGCRVLTAVNGREAVDRAREQVLDVVLMDCQMPQMDGYEAARRIRELDDEKKRSVPIIALTEDTSEGNRERCFAAGMNDFLSKPVQMDALSRVITTWTQTNRDIMTTHESEGGGQQRGPILDPETIAGLRDLSEEGEPSLFDELVGIFLEDTPVRMEHLEEAFAKADADELSRAAHALKSSAANLGALRLSEMFKELESAGRSGEVDGVESLIRDVRQEYERVQIALQEEVE